MCLDSSSVDDYVVTDVFCFGLCGEDDTKFVLVRTVLDKFND